MSGRGSMSDTAVLDVRVDEAARHDVDRLRARLHSPLCGLLPTFGFVAGTADAPAIATSGADLTGVHVLLGAPAPRAGAYHIGGAGRTYAENVIRALGETVERYAAHIAVLGGGLPRHFATYTDLCRDEPRVLPIDRLPLFRPEQLAKPGFPFAAADPDRPLGWVEVDSLVDRERWWVPAQLILVGYLPRVADGEPWLLPAVTTGTAAHRTHPPALLNALHELTQLDAAMGHWYGARPAVRIVSDARTRALDDLVAKTVPRDVPPPEFYLLPNADLPGFAIACVLRSSRMPAVAVGLGSDDVLTRAMDKSLLEASGVRGLALWRLALDEPVTDGPFFDLDSNVAYYGRPEHAHLVLDRFAAGPAVAASSLPPDDTRPLAARVRGYVARFRETGKRLYYADLTTTDVHAAGFAVVRVWSPDTVSLPFPDAPPAAHPRFADYGGYIDHGPHPYP